MVFKANHVIDRLLLISVFVLVTAGCTASESAQPEPVQPVAAVEELSTAEDAESDVGAEAAREAEPLNLAYDLDVQTVASVLDRDDVFLLDVREPREHQAGHIAGNTLIPTGAVAARLAEIPKDKEVIIYCHSGARSARVTRFLTEQGYTNVHNMLGGIVAWQNAGLTVEQ